MRPSEHRAPSIGALASALVEALAADPAAISRLRELVAADPPRAQAPPPGIYTVASLAAVLQVSARVVRGAIARGELAATKRGGRYIISARAVDDWAAADPHNGNSAPDSRRIRTARPRGPLRATLDALGDTNHDRVATEGVNLRSSRL